MAKNPSAEEYLPLLRTQQNMAFEWVIQGGFDPRRFRVSTAAWGKVPCTRFEYEDTAYFFDISTARGSYHVRHSPGASELLTTLTDFQRDFGSLSGAFLAWLSYLRREIDAPDLWAMAHEAPHLYMPGGNAADNAPFSIAEQRQVAEGVERLRSYLLEVGVTGEALREANTKLDYLVNVSGRVGHFDWTNIAFSVVWSIVVAAAFNPSQARELFEILASPLRSLLGG